MIRVDLIDDQTLIQIDFYKNYHIIQQLKMFISYSLNES